MSASQSPDGGESTGSEPSQTKITLSVGGRIYQTLKTTLTSESPFFEALLSDRWGGKQDDGSYFVDADPELFEHILRYLRRGTYPFLYDPTRGFDVIKYTAIQHEAEYFQIESLAQWIRESRYKSGEITTFRSQVFVREDLTFIRGMDDFINHHCMEELRLQPIFNRQPAAKRVLSGMFVAGKTRVVKPEVFKAVDTHGLPPY